MCTVASVVVVLVVVVKNCCPSVCLSICVSLTASCSSASLQLRILLQQQLLSSRVFLVVLLVTVVCVCVYVRVCLIVCNRCIVQFNDNLLNTHTQHTRRSATSRVHALSPRRDQTRRAASATKLSIKINLIVRAREENAPKKKCKHC